MNRIHQTAIIGPSVEMGIGNYVGPYCVISGNTKIGNNNRFEGYCSIGTPPEHRDYFTIEDNKTVIGDNNTIREFTTIHSGTISDTRIGSYITILNHSHIAHDCYIEDNVVISANVTLAGHCYVMEGANIALGCLVHQFQVIGAYSMLGMGSIVTKPSRIEPGNIYIGSPAKLLKPNHVGLQRANINKETLALLSDKFYKLLNEL